MVGLSAARRMDNGREKGMVMKGASVLRVMLLLTAGVLALIAGNAGVRAASRRA